MKLKAAVRSATMVRVRVAVCVLVPFATVRVTVLVPADAYVWLGCWAVLVAPSPKFHCQEVGDPVDVSVNCTACPVAGEAGLNVNDAAKGAATVTVRVDVLELEPFVTVKVTVLVPADAYVWLGCWIVLVAPSPKFQDQAVGPPVEASVNWTACPAAGAAGEKVKEDERTDMEATVIV